MTDAGRLIDGRLTLWDDEAQLEHHETHTLAVGDRIEVWRERDRRVGTATVAWLEEDGTVMLDVQLVGGKRIALEVGEPEGGR